MRLHEASVQAAAHAIKLDRYMSCTVSDEELARRVIETYKEHVPHRGRVSNRRPGPPSPMPAKAPPGVLPD